MAAAGGGTMRILVGGVVSLSPFAPGTAWHHLHYAEGFRRLGHDVTYVEHVQPGWCTDSEGRPCPFARSANRALFRSVMEHFRFTGKACQVYHRGEETFGLSLGELLAAARGADLLVNISGEVKLDPVLDGVRRRVYVDEDPVYTRLWYAEYGKDLNLKRHDVFF